MIKGKLYELNSSTSCDASFVIQGLNYQVIVDNEKISTGLIDELTLSPRIGNIQRKITLNDNRVFTTSQNDLVDSLLLKEQNKSNILYKIESNLTIIFLSFLVVIATTFFFLKWGLPYLSKELAYKIPYKYAKQLGEESLSVLDQHFFELTELDKETQERILLSFQKDVIPYLKIDKDINFQIYFRQLKLVDKEVPNAFALPDGTIVLTDKFVKLSKNKHEINAVLFHETAHVIQKHSFQRIIQGFFIAIFIMYISGDATIISDFGIGLGSLFTETYYSRVHELEADKFAFEKMLESGVSPVHFINILNRISNSNYTNDKNILDYFSSHPTSEERSIQTKKYQMCFEKNIIPCR